MPVGSHCVRSLIQASLQYVHIFFEPMLKALGDNFPEVRQAAAYGCGIMAMKGGPAYAQHSAQALGLLAAAIDRTDARATEEVSIFYDT
jgi:hypothetical protein